ncbi:GntR family transcriptional regulator [Microbacterium sp. Root53]|uniref:GntR family transcriptional regulator n=1 Tax=Microbacterium sp. Root53 TaxID=1736553 RepID=UPI0009EA8F38|nr:GntR family transcriptional regulator [Microbacterium sp. Root53]
MRPLVRTPQPRLADLAFERIAGEIIAGRLAPGETIRDSELADSMGVSRMPVREALQRLERIGLVEVEASRYTRVTHVTPELAPKRVPPDRAPRDAPARTLCHPIDTASAPGVVKGTRRPSWTAPTGRDMEGREPWTGPESLPASAACSPASGGSSCS